MTHFIKRHYRFKQFVSDAVSLGKRAPSLIGAIATHKVDPRFREKVLLAVTSVNQCRYCNLVHTSWAQLLSVDPNEIEQIKALGPCEACDPDELPAIEFAQHYAQTKKNPAPERLAALHEKYGKEKADALLLFLDLIWFANLSGNTFDAFLSRLKGHKAPDSNLAFEVILASVLAPILLPQAAIIGAKNRLGF
jgi:AhpD family alkylhydroperoxidase